MATKKKVTVDEIMKVVRRQILSGEHYGESMDHTLKLMEQELRTLLGKEDSRS